MKRNIVSSRRLLQITGGLLVAAALAGCGENSPLGFLKGKDAAATAKASPALQPGGGDIEAPELFARTETGLWDGRPSLGGIWVAHPDVDDPQRVRIRNQSNQKTIVGALFRRERALPGPRFQVSSEAAAALGMLAGAPAELDVIALKRAPEPEAAPETTPAGDGAAASETPAAADPPEAGAGAEPATTLSRPFVQVGIFSTEQNAERAATQLRDAGLPAQLREHRAGGKSSWRVLAGPAQSESERRTLLTKAKAAGYADAYAVAD